MGSSGAFTVCLLKALALARRTAITPGDLAEAACEIEIDVLKEPVGKQDQYVAAHGGICAYTFNADGTVDVESLDLDEATLHKLRHNLMLEKLKGANDDQKVGIDIVRRALQTPIRQIVENSGTDGSVVVGKLLEKGDVNHGYDAQKGEYVDMIKAGIIDPTKVVRLALQDAASVAGLLVTTEAMVADNPRRSSRSGDAGGGMGDMDY